MAKISGTLTDGAGQIINNCTIELYAKKTSSKVLTQTQAFKVADNGRYEMDILPCNYEVSLIINGFPKKKLGTIQVFSDSVDGTLNDYLLNPAESEITPAILQQVMDLRNEAAKSAESASDNAMLTTKNADEAKTAANGALNSAQSASESASNAGKSETNAAALEINAKNYSDAAVASAKSAESSKAASTLSEKSAKNSADIAEQKAGEITDAAVSATNAANNAAQSEKNAKISENNAAASAAKAETSETNSAASEKSSANNASAAESSAASASNSESNAGKSAVVAAASEANAAMSAKNAKTSEEKAGEYKDNAAQSAQDAKNYASSIDISNYVKKSDMVGEFKLFPFRTSELPFGWYFRGGDNYLLSSPQGQVLNSLSTNYKTDHGIIVKTINGQQYINVPTAFASDGRGYFERSVNGTTRQVGATQDDAIRNIAGGFSMDGIIGSDAGVIWGPSGPFYENGTNSGVAKYAASATGTVNKIGFDVSRTGVPTSTENRPLNIGMTPAIYLGV